MVDQVLMPGQPGLHQTTGPCRKRSHSLADLMHPDDLPAHQQAVQEQEYASTHYRENYPSRWKNRPLVIVFWSNQNKCQPCESHTRMPGGIQVHKLPGGWNQRFSLPCQSTGIGSSRPERSELTAAKLVWLTHHK